jgi:hypothetical protein
MKYSRTDIRTATSGVCDNGGVLRGGVDIIDGDDGTREDEEGRGDDGTREGEDTGGGDEMGEIGLRGRRHLEGGNTEIRCRRGLRQSRSKLRQELHCKLVEAFLE